MASKSKEELLDMAVSLLREIEWDGEDSHGDHVCLFCYNLRDYDKKHEDDCKLKLFLEEVMRIERSQANG